MDYVEVFQNLRTNNKYGRKSSHKAVLMLTVIELYEQNMLSENEIFYDDALKTIFLKVWNRVLPEEPLFHSEAYLPFWYLQSDSFWHIVPVLGKEDILTLMRDTNIKPSEAKLNDCVKYAELDEDLYFLMTLPSGRSSLKRALLETYTNLTKKQIVMLAESSDNSVDYSASALSDYSKILSKGQNESKSEVVEADSDLVLQFQNLNEDLQIVLNLQYYSFLKSHRNEREVFKEVCPTVYDLFDKIVNHPVKQGDILPSFAFMYDNFLSDLKIALMSEEGSMFLIDKIIEAIELLRGNIEGVGKEVNIVGKESLIHNEDLEQEDVSNPKSDDNFEDLEIEHVFVDIHGKIIKSNNDSSGDSSGVAEAVNRRGSRWTEDEEETIKRHFQEGKDIAFIAKITGRTEIAIKSRLAKLGLIDYTFGQEDSPLNTMNEIIPSKAKENDFTIKSYFERSFLLNSNGEVVFATDGNLKYINGKLYRLNLKKECFTLKSMLFNGLVWQKGIKKIVAYPRTKLFQILVDTHDYCSVVEDIVDSSVFEECKLKAKGIWYSYQGNVISNDFAQKEGKQNIPKQPKDSARIKSDPLYAVRKQAIFRALSLFRAPATIRNIARAISRTAWRSVINEDDVEDIIKTLSEVESIDGKYILRKNL